MFFSLDCRRTVLDNNYVEDYLWRRKIRVLLELCHHDSDDDEDGEHMIDADLFPLCLPSLAECIWDGVINENRVQQRRRLLNMIEQSNEQDEDGDNCPHPSRKHSKKMPILATRKMEDGKLEEIMLMQSLWYILFVSHPNVGCKQFQNKFHRRFRMPYTSFV